jgi:hypothetical protein
VSEDYLTRLEGQLAQLTLAGAHLDAPGHRRQALEHAVRRAAAVVALSLVLAAMLVIEFPGSASGRAHRGADHPGWVALSAIAPAPTGRLA